jgi:basic membrane protein A
VEAALTISTTKKLAGITAAAGLIIALAGCGSAPDASNTGTAGAGGAVDGFKPCMVSDAGGFDDKSFNQLGYEGLQKAAGELGVDFKAVESSSESDYAPNLQSLVDDGCKLIITVGFALAAAPVSRPRRTPRSSTSRSTTWSTTTSTARPTSRTSSPSSSTPRRRRSSAGYASASYSTAKKVGTFGGMNFPTVSIFMDGFKQGVEYWNKEKGDNVQVIGWDGTDGVFTGGFEANQDAINAAQGIVDQGVDVLLPVGGPIYQSAASVIRSSGREIALVGVDADVFETDPSVGDLLLTSIRKLIDVGVEDAVMAAGKGSFDATPFIGTLENEGVGLAPFHDFESKVSPDLQGELDKIKAGIIDGSITVKSYLAG